MDTTRGTGDQIKGGRRDRLLKELDHDPYHSKLKLKEPTACTDCGAIFHLGRWTWGQAPANADAAKCPACQRIADNVPAAFLTLGGSFINEHKEEIMNLIDNYKEREKAEHPLKRIMGFEERDDGLEFTLTDAHLARGIGEALHNAYQGDLNFQYSDEDIMLRVTWRR